MKDYTDAKDMYYELLANKMHFLKTDEQEVGKMCEIIEKYAQERASETKAVTTLQNAVKLVQAGVATVEVVSNVLGVPVHQIEEALNAESSEPKN